MDELIDVAARERMPIALLRDHVDKMHGRPLSIINIPTMAPTTAANPMSTDQSSALAEFARACRAAARSVSLYPRTHPAIQAALLRVTAAAGRLIPADDLLLDPPRYW